MPKSKKTTSPERGTKKSSSKKKSGLLDGIIKEGPAKIAEFLVDKTGESFDQYRNRSTPEFEGLSDSAEQSENAADNADQEANAFRGQLQDQGITGHNAGLSESEEKELKEKQDEEKKAAQALAFASGRLAADNKNQKLTKHKIGALEEEGQNLIYDTTGPTAFMQAKPQSVLEITKDQNNTEAEANLNISNLESKLNAQNIRRSKKATKTEAAAKQKLIAYEQFLLDKNKHSAEGTPRNSSPNDVATAFQTASEANKALLETLKNFEATANAIKTYAAATSQKLQDVIKTLDAQAKAIQELKSSRQSGMPLPTP